MRPLRDNARIDICLQTRENQTSHFLTHAKFLMLSSSSSSSDWIVELNAVFECEALGNEVELYQIIRAFGKKVRGDVEVAVLFRSERQGLQRES